VKKQLQRAIGLERAGCVAAAAEANAWHTRRRPAGARGAQYEQAMPVAPAVNQLCLWLGRA
jgi:hypothetical protein